MANLVGKLGQTIQGSVANFGSGLRQAAVSGNPALFGAALGQLEKAISRKFDEDKKERAKDREERKRDKQFNEEKENEQRKLDNDILKALRGIEKLMEARVGKKDGKQDGGLGFLGNLAILFRESLGKLALVLGALIASLQDGFSDLLKAFSGIVRSLAKKGLAVVDDLLKAFAGFFKGVFDKIKSTKLGAFIDDLLIGFKTFFKELFGKFKSTSFTSFIDDAFKSVKIFFTDFFEKFSSKLKSFFDVELDILKGLKSKLGAGWAQTKEMFNKGLLSITNFFEEVSKLPIIGKLAGLVGGGLKSFVRAIPIIGNLIMVIEGIFAAFDTDTLADTLGKATETINLQDRIIGFVGGLIGSIFGILDLIPLAFEKFFDINLSFADGESIQTKATRLITQFVYDFFAYFDGVFKVIGGLFTLDGQLIQDGIRDMSLIVEDWFIGFKNFMGNIVKVPFAKLTNAVATGIEIMVNGVIEAMNSFVGFILDGLAKLPGISKDWAEKKKKEYQIEKVNIGRTDESPYKQDTSQRSQARQQQAEANAQKRRDAAKKPSSTPAGSAPSGTFDEKSVGTGNKDGLDLLNRVMDQEGIVDQETRNRLIQLAKTESSLNPNARGPVINDPRSMHRGDRAYGILQVMPKTAPEVGFSARDLQDPEKAATAGVRYFIKNLNRFGGNMDAATVAHHSGPGGAERYLRTGSAGTRDVATGLSTDSYLRKVISQPSGGPGGMMQTAGYRIGGETTPLQEEDQKRAIQSLAQLGSHNEQQIEIQDDTRIVISQLPSLSEQQIKAYNEQFAWQQKQAQRSEEYQRERDALQDRFQNTLERTYKNIFDKMAGPGGWGAGTQPGGARSAIEKAVTPAFEKLGVKIFGKETGSEMGQIFAQLAGNYGDQFASQVIGPAIFGSTEAGTQQANRFFNSIASGNKKHATEDLIKGVFGVSTGVRSAMGYEEGAAQIAKDLAILTGAPFDPMFKMNVGGGKAGSGQFNDPASRQLTGAVADPIVQAQYDTAGMIIEGLGGIANSQREGLDYALDESRRIQRIASTQGGGTTVRDAFGRLVESGQASTDRQAALGRLGNVGTALLTQKITSGIKNPYLNVAANYGLNSLMQGMNPFASFGNLISGGGFGGGMGGAGGGLMGALGGIFGGASTAYMMSGLPQGIGNLVGMFGGDSLGAMLKAQQLMPYAPYLQPLMMALGGDIKGAMGSAAGAFLGNMLLPGVGGFIGAQLGQPIAKLGSSIIKGAGSVVKGVGNAIGGIAKGIGKVFSDERLKTDIVPMSVLPNGLTLYSYNWKNPDIMGSGRQLGYIAQDVERLYPAAVGQVEGIKTIDMKALSRLTKLRDNFIGSVSNLYGAESSLPAPSSRGIPPELQSANMGMGGGATFINNNNVIGNGNANVRSNPTNVISSTPMATSGTLSNRVVTPAY